MRAINTRAILKYSFNTIMNSFIVSPPVDSRYQLAFALDIHAVLIDSTTLSLVGLWSKLCICTYSINITFIDINSLLLYHAFLNSGCIPRNDHFLRLIFLLLLQLFFLRHTWAGKTETITNIMHRIIVCMFFLFKIPLDNRVCDIEPVLKFEEPLKLEFLVIASNIHLQ